MKSECVIWLTGLPGTRKTTIARIIEDEFHKKGVDEARKNVSPELGFSKQESLHVKECPTFYVSHLLSRNGIITILALISPYGSIRDDVRIVIGKDLSRFGLKFQLKFAVRAIPNAFARRQRKVC
jgi:adenylylsulfate kinase